MLEQKITPLEKAVSLAKKLHAKLAEYDRKTFILCAVLEEDQRATIGENGEKDKKIKSVRLLYNNSIVEVPVPDGITVSAGDTVKCVVNEGHLVIMEKSRPSVLGNTVVIKTKVNDNTAEIETQNGTKLISVGRHHSVGKGDRVVLDETGSMVVQLLGKDRSHYTFTEDTSVHWDDIGGLAKEKKELIDAIEGPIRHKELYAKYGRKPTKGILLYGPAGNGKTLVGKAIATSVKTMHGSKSSGFMYIKGPEILNMYVGVSEERIRSIFTAAREYKKQTGNSAVIFIDEAESILSKRGSGKSSDIDKTIVPAFLSEMDGLEESGALVVLTTNRPDVLDTAIVREGRIDKKIRIGRPDKEAASSIFLLSLKNAPLSVSREKLSSVLVEHAYDEDLRIYKISTKKKKEIVFKFSDILSGAMVSAIANDSISMAIERDTASGKASGVSIHDVRKAVIASFMQNVRMNHEDHIKDLVHELLQDGDEISSILPYKTTVSA